MRARIAFVAASVAVMVGLAVPGAIAGEDNPGNGEDKGKGRQDKQCLALVIGGQQGDGLCIPIP